MSCTIAACERAARGTPRRLCRSDMPRSRPGRLSLRAESARLPDGTDLAHSGSASAITPIAFRGTTLPCRGRESLFSPRSMSSCAHPFAQRTRLSIVHRWLSGLIVFIFGQEAQPWKRRPRHRRCPEVKPLIFRGPRSRVFSRACLRRTLRTRHDHFAGEIESPVVKIFSAPAAGRKSARTYPRDRLAVCPETRPGCLRE